MRHSPQLGLWLARVAAIALGAVLPLAFAPFDLWWIAPLSLAGLFGLWRDARPREAWKLGYAFGLGMFSVGVSWIFVSMHHFGEAIVPVAGLITFVFAAVMAVFPALAGYLAARLSPEHSAVRILIAMPLAWMLLELIRGEFLGGFPWLNLGASQIHSALAGYGPVFGEYGMSLAVVMTASLLVMLFSRRTWWLTTLTLFTGLALWIGGSTLRTIDWVEAAGEPISVAIVQGNVEQSRKFDPQIFQATLDLYRNLTDTQAADAKLVVWPETAVPDTVEQAAPFLIEMQDTARARDQQIVAGVFDQDQAGRYYNTLLTLPVEGGRYYKRHLVPFGEYLPLRFLIEPFRGLIQVPMSDLTSGRDDQPLLQLAGHPVGASICYEATLARKINTALPEAAFLINASNDAWFGDSLAPHQHLQIAAMRCLESGRWMVRATNTGISALIDPQGQVVARTPQFEQAVLRGQITPMQGSTPFVLWGAWPIWLLSIFGLLALALVAYITAERRRR
ncbi:MAG: apolipoprotein N-acyltransferase [Halothiobacillaceae bacterium]|nr:apolipoprotein N-acyltransferase [Halothiobacillaceae bacterium]